MSFATVDYFTKNTSEHCGLHDTTYNGTIVPYRFNNCDNCVYCILLCLKIDYVGGSGYYVNKILYIHLKD